MYVKTMLNLNSLWELFHNSFGQLKMPCSDNKDKIGTTKQLDHIKTYLKSQLKTIKSEDILCRTWFLDALDNKETNIIL